MNGAVEKYFKYKRNIELMFFGCGVWPGDRDHPSYLDAILSSLAVLVSTSAVLGVLGFSIANYNNINRFVAGVGLACSFSSCLMKVCVMLYYRQQMITINRGITKQFEDDLKKEEHTTYLMSFFTAIYRFFIVFNYVLGIRSIIVMVKPLFALRHGSYIRTYPQYIPFNYEPGGVSHWIIYGIEALFCMYLWRISCGADSLFGLYFLHIVGELRLLSRQFEKLSFNKSYKKDLQECIRRHVLINDSHRILQKIFGLLTIWLTISCAFIICAIIFQATEIQNMSTHKVIDLTCYVIIKLMQAYSYAWYGNTMTVHSSLCIDSIYKANWPESGNIQFMNDVLIIQSQNPLIFKALGCVLVQLDLFLKILQTSVSYFFLLQTLDEKA